MSSHPELSVALGQMEFARRYLFENLNDVDPADWFRIPEGCPTHLAWQVGHVAMAEYGLALFRQRGRRSDDASLMSGSFRKLFLKGSQPKADAAAYPSVAEILGVLVTVREQVKFEAPTFTAEQLAEPVDMPYAVHANKLGALYFCALHEMLHAGQIGLWRRLIGLPPLR